MGRVRDGEVKHSMISFLDIVYQHYPRHLEAREPGHDDTDEHRRLVAARRRAGAEKAPWQALLRRLGEKFPGCAVLNHSLHLPTGDFDAAYAGKLCLPQAPGEHTHVLGFFVGFLAPCYIVYSSRIVDEPPKESHPDKVTFHFSYDWKPEDDQSEDPPVRAAVEVPQPPARREIRSFEFSPDEQPYATAIAEDIEASWGYERMPPEVGKILVPEVATNLRALGEATLYDCLMSDRW